jgi:signal peptidase I
MKRRWRSAIAQIVLTLLVLGLVLVRVFLYRPMVVRQSSMHPTLEDGDRVLVNTWNAGLPERGSIIVLKEPRNGVWVVKRLIAGDGEKLQIMRGVVYVNGRALNEPYALPFPDVADDVNLDVPAGTIYVLGDNRPGSQDSRDYGPVPVSNIIGRAVAVFWPRDRAKWLVPGK